MSLSIYTLEQIADMQQRRICTKSHYKMKCECCGKTIHRGDDITQMLGSIGRMRPRAMEFTSATEADIYGSYAFAPTRNKWVHLTCRPQYFKDWGNGSIGFFPYYTAYSQSIEKRMTAAAFDPDWGEDMSSIPHPEWKWETERIAAAVIPLQKKWIRNRSVKWTKKMMNATKTLDLAKTEAVYDWQHKWLKYLWDLLCLGSIAVRGRTSYTIPDEEKNEKWEKKVVDAFRILYHTHPSTHWQYKILNKLVNINIITGKARR